MRELHATKEWKEWKRESEWKGVSHLLLLFTQLVFAANGDAFTAKKKNNNNNSSTAKGTTTTTTSRTSAKNFTRANNCAKYQQHLQQQHQLQQQQQNLNKTQMKINKNWHTGRKKRANLTLPLPSSPPPPPPPPPSLLVFLLHYYSACRLCQRRRRRYVATLTVHCQNKTNCMQMRNVSLCDRDSERERDN